MAKNKIIEIGQGPIIGKLSHGLYNTDPHLMKYMYTCTSRPTYFDRIAELLYAILTVLFIHINTLQCYQHSLIDKFITHLT